MPLQSAKREKQFLAAIVSVYSLNLNCKNSKTFRYFGLSLDANPNILIEK